jgi:hypothetical protein
MNAIEILKSELLKHSEVIEGTESVNAEGVKYKYITYRLKYQHTAYFLRLLFEKAAEFVGKKYATQFFYNDESFYFDRAVMKGNRDGKISYKTLVILS